jgi:hypothetical protein
MFVVDPSERRLLIDKYRDGHRAVTEALDTASDDELDRRPAPEEWTAREVAHHLADSEMTSAIRLRKLLAEDQPVVQGYDENEFARRLHYDRPITSSLETLRAVRSSTAELLDRLTEADWAREGTHSESGRYTVEGWLEIYAAHAHDHADQIRRALGR